MLFCSDHHGAGGGQDSFTTMIGVMAPSLPHTIPQLLLVLILDADEGEVGKEHVGSLELEGPDGEAEQLPPGLHFEFRRSHQGLAVLTIASNLRDTVVRQSGTHWMKLSIGGIPYARTPLQVVTERAW